MSKQIFINLPVKDLTRAIEFYSKLGFINNPKFTDEKGAGMKISDEIYLMLLTEDFFRTFIKKEICDTQKSTEVINALTSESREGVDKMVNTAFQAGATPANDKYDYGWMYGWSFFDLDGHMWEILYIDPNSNEAKS